MTATEAELEQLYRRAFQLPRGPARFAAIDAVLRQADAAELWDFAFRTRMDAIDEFHEGGDTQRTFLAFSWCLARSDDRPELLNRGAAEELMWRYKWVASDVVDFPEVPMERTVAVLDDMERRYQVAGWSPHPVYEQRWENADHVGDRAGAAFWYDKMLTTKRDRMSNCNACVPTTRCNYHTMLGEYAKAVEVAGPGLRGGCGHQPQRILTALLIPLLHTGELERAVKAHRDAYPSMQTDRVYLGSIARHIRFCGLTGNEARGLELIEKHLSWLERPSSPAAEMNFLAAAALVLRRLGELGRGDLVVERISEDGSRRTESTVDELRVEFAAAARAIAARFDQRNGTAHQSSLIEEVLAEQPLVERLPLTVLSGRPLTKADPAVRAALDEVGELTAAGDAAGAASARLRVALAMRTAELWDDALETAEEAVRALRRSGPRVDELRARHLLFELYQRSWSTRDQMVVALDELVAELVRNPADHPEDVPPVAQLLTTAAARVGGDAAARWRQHCAQLCREAGDVDGERLALRHALHAAAGAASDAVPAIVARLDELGPGPLTNPAEVRDAAAVDVSMGRWRLGSADPGAALVLFDRAIARYAELPPSAGRDLAVDTWRARALLDLGRLDDALSLARRLVDQEDDADYFAWNARIVVARALAAQGDTEASEAYAGEENLPDDLEYDDYDDDDLDYLQDPAVTA